MSFDSIDDKVERYLAAGTRLVWIINPRGKYVLVHRKGESKPQVLGLEDSFDGEEIIPGFKLAVKRLFEQK